jgi:zinc protease
MMRILTSLLLLLGLSGCQHTGLEFTAVSAPSLPKFNPLINAPKVTTASLQPPALVTRITNNNGDKVHLFPDNASGLNHLRLVASSASQPFYDIDVLLQAFAQKRIWLIANSSLACVNTLQFYATLHSISIAINCRQNVAQAISLLGSFWQDQSFASMDIDTLVRKIKLNKHLDAYSGDEIDTAWAKKIMGIAHPYNQALNNAALTDALSMSALNKVQRRISAQASWMILANAQFSQQADAVKQANTLLQDLASASKTHFLSPSASLPTALPQNALSARKPNHQKLLYLIDAPGSVQTQVRVGYSLPSAQSMQGGDQASSMQGQLRCKFLSSWLGRGFTGRLYYDLREVRGLTYGIYGNCFDQPLGRTLKFYASTKIEHSGAFISGILDHLALAQQQQIPLAELSAIKTYLRGEAQLRQDNLVQRRSDFIGQQIAGLTRQDKQDYFNKLNALDPASVQKFAQHVFATPPVIMIRGDGDIIQQELQNKLKGWTIKRIKVE